ncbi:MAG: ribosome maturation factor RimM [Chitinispirillaceae bacterium]|nr:ribosome maturation factor RimM [Chitinispirillaceae bacterium]
MIAVGVIQSTFGLKGEFKVWAEGIFIERVIPPVKVFIGKNEKECSAFTLEKAVKRGKRWICNLAELKEIEAVKPLQGMYIFIEDKFLPELEEGTFYHFDLEGINVLSKDKVEIGKVVKVYNFPSTDCIEIECIEGKNILVPLTKEAIVSIDVKNGYMIIDKVFLEELL